jgi:hypothetical protein
VGFTALVVLGLIAIAALVWGFGGGSGGSGNGRHSSSDKGAGKASSGSNGGQGSGTNSGSGGTSATSTANWQPYSDAAGGYSISYPSGWQQSQPASSEVQFTDPTSGAYVLVAWTDTPGPDPAARWRSYSQSFASKHTNYHQIGIQPTTFDGMKAAAWEFTYTESGADLHAIDLGFVNSDKGYAIYTQTHSGDWSRYQNVFARFRSSFQAG